MNTLFFGRAAPCINSLALLAVSGTLWFAFAWQLLFKELPCPLCLLQRVGFAMVGIGLLLNIYRGSRPLHYGIAVLSALAGMVAAGRQVLLHITPGDPGYGSPFLGLHFYTWALVTFFVLLVWAGIMLMLDDMHSGARAGAKSGTRLGAARKPGWLGRLAAWAFLSILAINVLSTTVECGFGPCPDNPTRYQWLSP